MKEKMKERKNIRRQVKNNKNKAYPPLWVYVIIYFSQGLDRSELNEKKMTSGNIKSKFNTMKILVYPQDSVAYNCTLFSKDSDAALFPPGQYIYLAFGQGDTRSDTSRFGLRARDNVF